MSPKPEAGMGFPSVPLVCSLYTQGLSTRQIAAITGGSKSRIAFIIQPFARTRSEAKRIRQPAESRHWRSSRQAARRVWERANGPIPVGCHIHHRNGDFTDNRLENLALLSARDHAHMHRPPNPVPRHLRPERRAYMKAYQAAYWKRRKGGLLHATP